MSFIANYRGRLVLLFAISLTLGWVASSLRLSTGLALFMSAVFVYCLITEWFLIKRQKPRLALFMFSTSIILIAGWVALFFHLVLLTFAFPEVDVTLYAIDQHLGFDWKALAIWLAERPVLDEILRLAYASFVPQLFIVTMLLATHGRDQDLSDFLKAYVATMLFSVIVGGLLPAHAMCRMAGLDMGSDPEMLTRAACAFLPVYDSVRSGQLTEIQLSHLDGLVTFPSFHTTAAILFAWSVRAIPLAALILVPLNGLMIAATPTHGGHYLIDVIAGTAIALVGIAACKRTAKHRRTIFSHKISLSAAFSGKD